MANLAHAKSVATSNMKWHFERVEFFLVRSQSKNRKKNADYHQTWAEYYADLIELLDELIRYRNAAPHLQGKITWETRLIEKEAKT